MSNPSAIVVGVGAEEGLGAALSRRFARGGHHVFVAGRSQEKIDKVVATIRAAGGSALAITTDATNAAEVAALFEEAFAAGSGFDAPDLVVSNAGNNRKIPFLEMTADVFEEYWRVGCLSGFLVGQEAAKRFAPLARGTVIFTGASGSLRGKAGFAHFAAAKAGLRMISQSMAREFGPLGIHVAHVIIDGGIKGDRLREAQPSRFAAEQEDGLLDIGAIAETYWHIHCQPRSAWTQEVDLRPFKENY